jgi:hypothetical protein
MRGDVEGGEKPRTGGDHRDPSVSQRLMSEYYVPKEMATTGGSCGPVPDPSNWASPNVKTPPSAATSQYPFPSGVAAIPTMGLLRWVPPSAVDPSD